MRTQDIIIAKRDNQELPDDAISQIVLDYASGKVPDYQMSAFLMAAWIRGLSFGEAVALTRAMVASGSTLDLSSVEGTKVDKHSTGGVGDKTTLVVVPVLAACGLKVPKMSGRGLGFTGGTLDKLESIPGFGTGLGMDEFVAQVRAVGAAMAGQTPDIVPADQKMYALRDVTGTVESIPLIAASVMSKKIACSGDVILVDVKVGSGAFVPDMATARYLAEVIVGIGRGFGRKVGVMITDMSQPLGRAVGNALEVSEAIDALKGGGPADLRTLCIELSATMLRLAGVCPTREDCLSLAASKLDSGEALEVFGRIVEAQGGDVGVIGSTSSVLPSASHLFEVPAPSSGVVRSIECARVGVAASMLGAGREKKEDTVDPAVGVVVMKKLGDRVEVNEPLAVIHANDPDKIAPAAQIIQEAYAIGDSAEVPDLIRETID